MANIRRALAVPFLVLGAIAYILSEDFTRIATAIEGGEGC